MAGQAVPRALSIREANQVLHQVSRALTSLRRLQNRVRNLSERLTVLDLICDRFTAVANPDLREFLMLKVRYHRKIGQFHEILRDLESKGCNIQDLKSGVVHFEGRRGTDRVILCWREGEREVSHWHAIEDEERPENEAPRHAIEAWDQF